MVSQRAREPGVIPKRKAEVYKHSRLFISFLLAKNMDIVYIYVLFIQYIVIRDTAAHNNP